MESKYSFYATLTANVFLDDSDFDFITEVCRNHYDRAVREIVGVGGFLYGFKVRRTPYADWLPSDEERIVEFTTRQLGLIMKSFEMQSGEQASRLNLMFHKIASEMAIQQKTINKNITGFTTELKK
jgi:hypothetical protein